MRSERRGRHPDLGPRGRLSARGPQGLLLLAVAYLGFVSLGLPDGLLGVAWPSMRTTFGVPLDALAALLAAATAGYLVSSSGIASLIGRVDLGVLLALSCLATGVALFVFAVAPVWWIVVVAAGLLGAGGGAIDASLNTHFATHASPRTMSWLHACFGVGAFVGPLIMTGVLALAVGWQWGYVAVAVAQLALALAYLLSRGWWPRTREGAAAGGPPVDGVAAVPVGIAAARVDRRRTLRLVPARLGIAAFFVYAGVEAGAGQWSYTLLTEGRGEDPVAVGLWVSAYYAALTVARIAYGAVANAVRDELALRVCMATGIAATALVALDLGAAASFAGLAVLGLSLAPVYPALIAATPRRVGEADTSAQVGFQVSAAVLGASVLPGLMGVLAARAGLEAIVWSLLALGLALFAVHELVARTQRPG